MERRRADVRKDEILHAAARVVLRQGFARTRVADVAGELGVSTALVFYHFDTKERLLAEAFEIAAQRDLDRLERVVSRPSPPSHRLRAVLRLHQAGGTADNWPRDVDAWAEGLFTEEIREACRKQEIRWRAGLERVVVEGVESGEFHCDDPRDAALRIAVMLDGLAIAHQVRGTVSRARSGRWVAEYAAAQVGVPADRLLGTGRPR